MEIKGKDYVSSVAEQLVSSLNATQCTIRELYFGLLYLVAASGVEVEKREKIIPLDGTVAGEAVIANQVICIANILDEPRFCPPWFDRNGHPVSVLAIPFEFGDWHAVAQIYSDAPFTDKDIASAKILAPYAGLALRYEQQQKLNRQAILQVMRAVGQEKTYQGIFQHVADEVARVLEVDRCVIYKINGASCEIIAGTPQHAHGIGLTDDLELHPDIRAAMESDKIMIITSPLSDSRTAHFLKTVELHDINQILYAPVRHEGNVTGVIVLDASKDKRKFTSEEVVFCLDVAESIAFILKRDEAIYQSVRHDVINPVVMLGGLGRLVHRNLKENNIGDALGNASRVAVEAIKINNSLPPQMHSVH
ncbi:MAG: GAF domain-containing protein [bacterium]|nr:GAF domain-containing protein [bacterium]